MTMPRALSAMIMILILTMVHVSLVFAQRPNISGTWRLDNEQSRISPTAGPAGLVGAGAPATLHITHPANGTLVIESQINESHARLYKPGVKTMTPVTVGAGGTIAMTSRWDGRLLVAEGTWESSSGPATIVKRVKEVVGMTQDGRTLTIEITVSSPAETTTSTLLYMRLADVGPCKTWPTPCKFPPVP